MSNPDTRYTGMEAWFSMEVIKQEEVTSKDYGLVVYEMLAQSPFGQACCA